MRQEITIVENGVAVTDFDIVSGIMKKLENIAMDNITEHPTSGSFMYADGKIEVHAVLWGTKREDNYDVATLSSSFPNYHFEVVKRNDLESIALLESLAEYTKVIIHNGKIVETLSPNPITWYSDSSSW